MNTETVERLRALASSLYAVASEARGIGSSVASDIACDVERLALSVEMEADAEEAQAE